MKKQYMNYMKSCLLVMIACLVSMVGAAQGFSPAAMEQLKTRRLWSHSQNAAGMPFDDIQNQEEHSCIKTRNHIEKYGKMTQIY